MEISVRVVPNARSPQVVKTGDNAYRVKVNAPATEGRANARLIEILSEHFNVPKSRITVLRGHTSRDKIIEISDRR